VISVDEALGHILNLASPTDTEKVPLRQACGRVLAEPVVATRNQPPFRASVMDGYAVAGDADHYRVMGEAAAGHSYPGTLTQGECVRIFTGAVIPSGATRVVIQEDVHRENDRITLSDDADSSRYIREIGADFKVGDKVLANARLTPSDVALAASMNVPQVTVYRRPQVAFIATGDELVMPGEAPHDDQIMASNNFGLAALVEQEGAQARVLPIARDQASSLTASFELAASADLVVTIGGASVGDHDIVGQVAADLGMERAFYKIAMRPGKPLMAGKLGRIPLVGLPGNPVSSMVCGHIFLRPMVRAMQGLARAALPRHQAILSAPIGPNGPRQHFMRARLDGDFITAAERQDSSLLSVLSAANALLIRAPHDAARETGETVDFIHL